MSALSGMVNCMKIRKGSWNKKRERKKRERVESKRSKKRNGLGKTKKKGLERSYLLSNT